MIISNWNKSFGLQGFYKKKFIALEVNGLLKTSFSKLNMSPIWDNRVNFDLNLSNPIWYMWTQWYMWTLVIFRHSVKLHYFFMGNMEEWNILINLTSTFFCYLICWSHSRQLVEACIGYIRAIRHMIFCRLFQITGFVFLYLYDILLTSDWERWSSRPIRSLLYIFLNL